MPQSRAVSKDGKLSIINAKGRDFGWYTCEAENILGKDTAATQLLIVNLGRFATTTSKYLRRSTADRKIEVGCAFTGPLWGPNFPSYTWMKVNDQLPVGRSKHVGYTLTIWNPKEEDSGRYLCLGVWSEHVVKAMYAVELTVTKGNYMFNQNVYQSNR